MIYEYVKIKISHDIEFDLVDYEQKDEQNLVEAIKIYSNIIIQVLKLQIYKETYKMTFKQRLNRFFEPLIFDKKVTLKAILPAVLMSIVWWIILIVLKDITNAISTDQTELLYWLLYRFTWLSLLYYFLLIVSRNRTDTTIRPVRRAFFYKKYMHLFLQLDNTEVEKIWTWRLISIIDKWFHTHINQMVIIIKNILPNIIQILMSFIFIFLVNVNYWLLVLFLIFLLALVVRYQQNKVQDLRRDRKKLNISIMRWFVKILMSKFEILNTNKWDYEIDKLTRILEKNRKNNIQQKNKTIWVDLALRIFIDSITFIMILFFGFWLFSNTINIWEFASLIGIVYFLDKSLSQINSHYAAFLKNYVDIEKLRETFDTIPLISSYDIWTDFIYKNWTISLKKLSFSYWDKSILKNLSINIVGWQKVALVWESWWWKTTLIKLLAGYIKADSWDIIVDWQKISEIKLIDYYKHMGYLTQEPSVFDGTVYENLVYSLDRPPKENEIDQVIELSKCNFINNLKDWLKTEIGERGVRLSGWQKQRLAIAKIMLKNPNIIFLDEPTAALDSFNEEDISVALHNLFKWKTVIIIAHRLQTVKDADRILFIENWKIIEDWNHEELVKQNGKYKTMLDLQSGF